MSAMPRLFTHDEATAMLPVLRPILRSMQEDKRRLDVLHAEIESISPAMATNGHGPVVMAIEHEMATLIERLNNQIASISSAGIEVKDIDTGLVDFPSRRDGRIVYLCWRVDEPEIEFWHELDAGVAGRQPL